LEPNARGIPDDGVVIERLIGFVSGRCQNWRNVMKYIGFAAFGAAALCTNLALAQTSPAANESASPSTSMKLSQSECTNLWQQANPGNASGLTEAQSKSYVSDFKAANLDGDATIDQNEWMAACSKGLVKSSSSSGASTGVSGSSAKSSDRTPGNPAPDRTPGATGTGAAGTDAGQTPSGTSDRTPK
jgi:hypothetical protein